MQDRFYGIFSIYDAISEKGLYNFFFFDFFSNVFNAFCLALIDSALPSCVYTPHLFQMLLLLKYNYFLVSPA